MVELSEEVIFITVGARVYAFPLYTNTNFNRSTRISESPSDAGGFTEYPSHKTADVMTFSIKAADNLKPVQFGNAIAQGQVSETGEGGEGLTEMSTKRSQINTLLRLQGQDVQVATPTIADYGGFVSDVSVSDSGQGTQTAMVNVTVRQRPTTTKTPIRRFKATTIRVPFVARNPAQPAYSIATATKQLDAAFASGDLRKQKIVERDVDRNGKQFATVEGPQPGDAIRHLHDSAKNGTPAYEILEEGQGPIVVEIEGTKIKASDLYGPENPRAGGQLAIIRGRGEVSLV